MMFILNVPEGETQLQVGQPMLSPLYPTLHPLGQDMGLSQSNNTLGSET